jgi:cell division protein FtsQ
VVRGAAATVAGRLAANRRPLARPALSPRLRRRLALLAALCLLLAAGYQLWLRDSALVAVERVTVSGLTTKDAPRLRATLRSVARTMTTLHVDHERLERVMEAYPVVRGLEVSADFPSALRIHVVEHHPAAMAVTDDGRIPVAGDGTVLRGLPVERGLPEIRAKGGLRGDRLRDPAALDAARLAGAAPAPLRGRMQDVDSQPDEGLVVRLRDGPELIFGDASHARAKWTAAARVLADPAAAGATYIDLRLPDRPAAGGLPAETLAPVAPVGEPPPATAATGVPTPATGAAGVPPVVDGVPPAATEQAAPAGTTAAPQPELAPPPAQTPSAPLDGGSAGGATAAPAP